MVQIQRERVSDIHNNHSVRRTITTLGLPPGDDFLIQALLRFLDGRASDAWRFVDASEAEVVIIDSDRGLPAMPDTGGRLIVESTTDTQRQGELILHRPVRSRQFLHLLNALSARFASDAISEQYAPGPPIRGEESYSGAQYTTRSVISRIRSRLGLAS